MRASLKKVRHALAAKKSTFIFYLFALNSHVLSGNIALVFRGKINSNKKSSLQAFLGGDIWTTAKNTFHLSLAEISFVSWTFLPLFLLLCHATVLPNKITLVWMALWGENRPKNRIRISTGFYGPRLLGLTTHKGGEEDHPRGTRELFLSLLRPPPPPCLPRQKWKRRKEKEGIN